MFNRDTRWVGLLVGLVVPFVGYAVLLMISERVQEHLFADRPLTEPLFDTLTLQILALCMNLIPLHRYNKMRFALAMRGVVLATFLYAAAWMAFFGVSLFD